MSGMEQVKITRKKFVGLGLSAALLSGGVSPFVAKAQTVSFGAATTGKLSNYCRGDGSDETDQINKCLAEHLYVEIDEPPAGVGYGFTANNDSGLLLRSGHEVNGLGAASKLLRVGRWDKYGKGLKNEGWREGNSSIKLNNIYIDGLRSNVDVPTTWEDLDSTGVNFKAMDDGKWCDDIRLTRVHVHNWPGVGVRVRNGSNITFAGVRSVNPSRGGIIFNDSKGLNLSRCVSIKAGDDAIAFFDSSGITIDYCKSSTRHDPYFGAGLKIGGSREALVANSTFTYAKNSLVTLVSSAAGHHPYDVRVEDCEMIGGAEHSFEIKSNDAQLVSARRNYMHEPDNSCVYILSADGEPHELDVTIAENTLSNPGSTRHIVVQDNLSGVYTAGNELIYEYTTPPKLRLLTPDPDSTVSAPVKRIEVLAGASVNRRPNDLKKEDIRLYINDQQVFDFDYYAYLSKLVKTRPNLRYGSNTVRAEFTFIGKTTAKTWTFKVR